MSISQHQQPHYIHRTGWLRASVLGANDGIISVTSLVLGMAASDASTHPFHQLRCGSYSRRFIYGCG